MVYRDANAMMGLQSRIKADICWRVNSEVPKTFDRVIAENPTDAIAENPMIVMVMVVVDSAAADAVSVLLMMTVHGGEMNLKFQLEEILEKKDQNDQNSTYYQEANRLMKIQVRDWFIWCSRLNRFSRFLTSPKGIKSIRGS